MRWFLSLVAVFAMTSVSRVEAATYSYVSGDYTSLTPHTASDCAPVGGCGDFAAGQHISGVFTIDAPLPPFPVFQTVIPSSFSFTDGVTTYDSTDPAVREVTFRVRTDGAGHVLAFDNMSLERWTDGRLCCHATGAAGTTNLAARFSSMIISAGGIGVGHNSYCAFIGGEICFVGNGDTFSSGGFTNDQGAIAEVIPTLTPQAFLAWVLAMAVVGWLAIQLRPRSACPLWRHRR